ncbi:U-box domain-containing protein 35-like isoform X2 [Benincasa hispida]|uniref:U-box domain-containing protein 35-like isoform X2 n=1 Tax=Benincasa hispida TaxID=102211 RepID=UPI001901075E|nr:U-box domain-containing protein 35-like isoform X2 [Benincasa hispida]
MRLNGLWNICSTGRTLAIASLFMFGTRACIPVEEADTVPKECRPPTEAELHQFFLPYRGFCARKGIVAKEIIIHDIDVPSALIDYVSKHSISNIVVGASSRNAILRKFKNPDVPTSLLKSTPESCSVYVIARGKVHTKRLRKRHKSQTDARETRTRTPQIGRSLSKIQKSAYSNISGLSEDINRDSSGTSNDSMSGISDFSGPLSFKSIDTSFENTDFSLTTSSENSSRSFVSSNTPPSIESEMRKLRFEIKRTMEMYDSASKEAVIAKQKAKELQQLKMEMEEDRKNEHSKSAEETLTALAEFEKQKNKAATEAALMAQKLAELETQKQRIITEEKARIEAEERKKTMELFEHSNICYRRYSIDEIEAATDHFNESNKIGEGGYGPVYQGSLDHTSVAIKILRPDRSHGQRQFQQEIEVLSRMRHPHMVLLLGACPEYGCLVYEFMENGSLEDRLFQKDNTPPIPWRTRFKIASDIATALLFLHQMKPEPVVHRDLKPANILLDQNYVSKIGDVGLARLVPPSVADSVTQYHMTAAAGTFCYIDPEYQQTGMLGVKSDIYSFGVLLLQLITARSPMGLSYQVEEAIEHGRFPQILDPAITDWPIEDTLGLAQLALKCCELRKRDRPDLRSVLLPELVRLRNLGSGEMPPKGKLPNVNKPHDQWAANSAPILKGSESEIYVRKRWQRLKANTRFWSQKGIGLNTVSPQIKKKWSWSNSDANVLNMPLPMSGKRVDVMSKKQQQSSSERCWSFASCASAASMGLKKLHSFS